MARVSFAAAVGLVGLLVAVQAFAALGIRNLSSTAYVSPSTVNGTAPVEELKMDASAAVVAKALEEATAVLKKSPAATSAEPELAHVQRIQMEHSGWGCFGEFNSQEQAWICAGHSVS